MTFFKKSLCSFDVPVNIKELELIWRDTYLEAVCDDRVVDKRFRSLRASWACYLLSFLLLAWS